MYNNNLYIKHFGIMGMKWGIRRYQNPDGSLTSSGKERYLEDEYKKSKSDLRRAYKENRGRHIMASRKNIEEDNLKRQRIRKADLKKVEARAAYMKAKKGEKGERKAYIKEMKISGVPGSVLDLRTYNRSSDIYDLIAKKKGKEYAESIEKSVRRKSIKDAVVITAAYVGATLLASKMMGR